ncbi:MAG: dacB 1 [Clostridia bacterium]|nr:dacB 1 [Clostridia bacterium]
MIFLRKYIILSFLFITLFILNYNFIYGNFNDISEGSAIVLDAESSSIIYSKNINKKIFPASTTKILTAILVIENLDLDSNITVSKTAIDTVPLGSSIMYLKPGEILTVRELLYGLLLSSGSDAAIVLGNAVSGSIPNFMKLMNDKLIQLNCLNSHFTNPHGFHDNNHYSTAYDMAIIMKYASKNETFRTICETQKYLIAPTNKTKTERTLENTNLLLLTKVNYMLGGKTGYTEEAGNVFICYSNLNEKKVICGVFDGDRNIQNKKNRFIDTKMLLDNSFKDFFKNKILDKDQIKISYFDKKTNKNYIVGISDNIYCLTDQNNYTLNYNLSDINITNDIVSGKINITAKNNNWTFNNTYELKLNDTQSFENIFIKSNNYTLYTLIAMFLLLILLLNKKKKYLKNEEKLRKKRY